MLGSNQLVTPPAEIGSLHSLRVLDVSNNPLADVPITIWQLRALRYLGLANLGLRELPSEIGSLSNLCYLNIANNLLESLPGSLGQLHFLAMGDMCYTSYDRVQVYYSGLIWEGNPLSSLPEDVVDRGTATILAFLEDESWWHREQWIKLLARPILIIGGGLFGRFWYLQRLRRKSKHKKNVA